MVANLSQKTLFITGASRGIGKAIALRAAHDGANVVIAAKTAEPHPKLPGTIYTAADEIESAGGSALPLVVDIRDDDQVRKVINATVEKFGGIDIVVNNASAIALTDTLATSMKRFDLMHAVNVRGTFHVTQQCLPHLSEAENPHILNIAPPLNLDPKWFGPHLAYTMSKYGMSMCVLGMTAEFADRGVAVNGLWPRTAIATAAIENLLGGSEAMARCRKPEIMADAAYWILTQPSRDCSGNFFIDDDVIQKAGIDNLAQYAVQPGAELLPDFFV